MKKSLIVFCMLSVFITGTFVIAGYAAAADRYFINRDQTVYDTQTNLTWAARDNGYDINWAGAKSYCERNGWRMPTYEELIALRLGGGHSKISFTAPFVWTVEGYTFTFVSGTGYMEEKMNSIQLRALPVRTGK